MSQNKFWAQKILCPKILSQKIGPKKHCVSKIISGKTLVKISLVFDEICHYTETRTNDAETNVAW